MKSSLPKLLHPLAGLPMISHVLATARALDAAYVVTVVRHERDRLAAIVAEELPESLIVDQDETPGTGRAVEQAVAALPADFEGDVLVINGDVPLLDADTLIEFVAAHRAGRGGGHRAVRDRDDATGYGRIIRSEHGAFDRIVEQKDATEAELAIDETNAGVYLFGLAGLRDQLARLTTGKRAGREVPHRRDRVCCGGPARR